MSASPKQPLLTLIAGPNGSGKSTIVSGLLEKVDIGILVNADVIAVSLARRKGETHPSRETQWEAAVAAEEMRWALVSQHISLATETVMSDLKRWSAFIEAAKTQGFRIILYFVTTDHPSINVKRVNERVLAGGHAVDPDKIVSRYRKTMDEVLPLVLKRVDEAILFDNSRSAAVAVLVLEDGTLSPLVKEAQLPEWAKAILRLVE